MASETSRDRLREALRDGPFSSVKVACAVFAGMVGIALALGTGIHAVSGLTLQALLVLALASAASFPVSLIVHELVRFKRIADASRDALREERTFELLLADARKERDDAIDAVAQLKADLILEARLDERLRALPPAQGPTEETQPGGRKPVKGR